MMIDRWQPINEGDTLYSLHFRLEQDCDVTIGKLGCFHFPKGQYVYVGSAKRNIQKRVERHLRLEKPKRWHIDYIRPYGIITHIQSYNSIIGECQLAQDYFTNGNMIVKGFGSSDCHCSTHFIYLGTDGESME